MFTYLLHKCFAALARYQPPLTFIVLAVADGLFGCWDELLVGTRPPPPPPPTMSRVWLLWTLTWKKNDDVINIIHSFYVALFFSLEQTHCAHVACDSEWVTVSFFFVARIIHIHGNGVLVALCGCCMAGATMHQVTVSLHSKPHR